MIPSHEKTEDEELFMFIRYFSELERKESGGDQHQLTNKNPIKST
jgi:hypothetical protein